MKTTRETAEKFFTAFGSGDLDAVKNLFAEEINLSVHGSPKTPWAGHITQRSQLDKFFSAFTVLGPATEYVVDNLLIDGEHAVALGRNSFPVLSTGKSFKNHFALHFTITDGKIVGYQMYEDSYAVDQAFTE